MTRVFSARLSVPVGERDHILGKADAPVSLVEYGDYECPHCGRAQAVLAEIREQLGRNLQFVFRHFPLTTIHPHAQRAAEAAEAAGAQGLFWEMHEQLFANQESLGDDALVLMAGAVGLDRRRFVLELTGHVHAGRVRDDVLGGAGSGVNGTPAFFINGLRHDGSYDLEGLLDGIERATNTV